MDVCKNIKISIDEAEVTVQELRKLRNKYYSDEDYDTAEKVNKVINLYEDFKNDKTCSEKN